MKGYDWKFLTVIMMLLVVIGLQLWACMCVNQDLKKEHLKEAHSRLLSRLLPFGGPYEACEDIECPNYENKKECMLKNQDKIKKCCEGVCRAKCVNLPAPALQECLSACTPTFV